MTMEHIARYFHVSLHIQHPTIDPQEITDAIQLTPKRTRQAGPPRKPPFDFACWAYEFDVKGARELEVVLEGIAGQLKSYKDFFYRIVEEGGAVELFCGIHAAGNWDEVLNYSLMGQLSDLAIELGIEGSASAMCPHPTLPRRRGRASDSIGFDHPPPPAGEGRGGGNARDGDGDAHLPLPLAGEGMAMSSSPTTAPDATRRGSSPTRRRCVAGRSIGAAAIR